MTETAEPAIPVLVTRPAHQNALLAGLLREAGFLALNFPTIAIAAAQETPFLRGLNQRIHDFDIALFVSRNAVDFAFKYLSASDLPASLQMGVIGKGTLKALREFGADTHIIPSDSFNSEGLLASSVLQQVAGKRVIIFRGQEGRTLLGDTLAQRGAAVEHVEVYRRVLPTLGAHEFDELCAPDFPRIAVFTSSEGLRNCFELLNVSQADRMRGIDWLLISERMGETARDLRHNARIIIAHNASDEGILGALQEWRHNQV
jgi:uroporphyrinogen-III synthase